MRLSCMAIKQVVLVVNAVPWVGMVVEAWWIR